MPSAGKILDSGVVTSSAGGYIVDTTKAWLNNIYVNSYIYFPRTGLLALISVETPTSLAFSATYVAVVGEAYTIRENASTPPVIPTTANLLAYDAAGGVVMVPVSLT